MWRDSFINILKKMLWVQTYFKNSKGKLKEEGTNEPMLNTLASNNNPSMFLKIIS